MAIRAGVDPRIAGQQSQRRIGLGNGRRPMAERRSTIGAPAVMPRAVGAFVGQGGEAGFAEWSACQPSFDS